MTYYDFLLAHGRAIIQTKGTTAIENTRGPRPLNGGPYATNAERSQSVSDWRNHLGVLQDEGTKRIHMDSRQVATFDGMDELPPAHWQKKLHPPFRSFYMEFNEPILIGEQEPGYEDYLRAILYRGGTGSITYAGKDGYPFTEGTEPTEFANVTFFLDNGVEDRGSAEFQSVDRSFIFALNVGMPMTHLYNLQMSTDPSQVAEDYPPESFIIAGDPMGIENRYMGWWERTIIDHGGLISWLFMYMMAKGIEIIVAPRSRAERRREDRKEFPQPWHIVRVEPRLVPDGGPSSESGITHGYRYDVMGHLRFGKHKLASGDYRQTIEWVPPHQRGLAHELYIPKTSKFQAGKQTHPIMDNYFTKEK